LVANVGGAALLLAILPMVNLAGIAAGRRPPSTLRLMEVIRDD
jgi:hypothetical protein